jgi:leader peptidase (prepilin peptidase)/N-methyltransferase
LEGVFGLEYSVEVFLKVMVFVLGLSVGSFINMAVFRTAIKYKLIKKKKNLVRAERSFCDFCGKQLRWYENVPVWSWVMQKGKSRCCDSPLPREYPVVEIVTGLLFLLNFQFSIFNFQSILNYLILGLLIFSLVFDLKYMILPDAANYLLTMLALVLLIGRGNYWLYLWSGVGNGIFFFILNRIRIRGSEAMGIGDVKYALFMGLFLGVPQVLVAGYFAFVAGALVSVILLVLKRVKKTDPIPFGPFLILGTGAVWIWGEKVINMVNLFR